ncbi:hypothetical protein Taro_055557, partial [Colocasia esculenta]|nr:hypothetical protein [Colocasia esculenta]
LDLPVHPPAFTDSGEPAAFFSLEEIHGSCAPLEFALVARTPQGRPAFQDIRNHLSQRFNFKKDFMISALDSRHLLLRFQVEEDYLALLLRESLYVQGIPANFYQDSLLRSIAGNIGHVLKVDSSSLNMSNTTAAKVCVEFDVTKSHPKRIWIGWPGGGGWQPISFCNMPLFCSSCLRLGHDAHSCKMKTSGGAPSAKTLPVDPPAAILKDKPPVLHSTARADAGVHAPKTNLIWRPVRREISIVGAPVPASASGHEGSPTTKLAPPVIVDRPGTAGVSPSTAVPAVGDMLPSVVPDIPLVDPNISLTGSLPPEILHAEPSNDDLAAVVLVSLPANASDVPANPPANVSGVPANKPFLADPGIYPPGITDGDCGDVGESSNCKDPPDLEGVQSASATRIFSANLSPTHGEGSDAPPIIHLNKTRKKMMQNVVNDDRVYVLALKKEKTRVTRLGFHSGRAGKGTAVGEESSLSYSDSWSSLPTAAIKTSEKQM